MKLAILTKRAELSDFIRQCFASDNASCVQYADDVSLARATRRDEFNAILIDADTGTNALRPLLARRICYEEPCVPVILIGVPDDRASTLRALDAGADDLVLAPVSARELITRVHLASRRSRPPQTADAEDVLVSGTYRLDRRSCVAFVGDKPVPMTPREFAIAWLLFSHDGKYVSRRHIAGAVWSSTEDIVGRTLEQHIYKLRKKLELHGIHGRRVQTMYAHGYRIEAVEMPNLAPAEVAATV